MNRTQAFVGATLLLAASASSLHAELISTFQTIAQGQPAANWSYLTNHGPIGTGPYVPLVLTTHENFWWKGDASLVMPSAEPDGLVNFGRNGKTGLIGGHPGLGVNQPGSGGYAHFAIAAYTVTSDTPVSIAASTITNLAASHDGVDVLVFLNNTLKFSTYTAPGQSSSATFDVFLGNAAANDQVFVAIGPRGTDQFDSFSLTYNITNDVPVSVIPEPASAALTLAAIPLLSRRRRA